MPKHHGYLIALYGANNTGKTTQAQLLVKKLRALRFRVSYFKYPRYDLTPSGTLINQVLRNSKKQSISEEELQMWYVLNRFQAEPELRKKLKLGHIVVAEDYIGTGIAWGVAKGVDRTWLETLNQPLIHEHLAVMLRGQRFLSGKENNHLHERNTVLMKKAANVHDVLAKRYGWKVVNASQDISDVAEDVWEVVQTYLRRR